MAARAGPRELLASVPAHYGVVRAAWRNFVPRPGGHPFFAERMTVRLRTPSFHPHPLSTHSKSAHRAAPDVRISRGNHEAFGTGLNPVRGWYPIEILHFPVRSLEHCLRKYVTQFVALERNAEKGIRGTWRRRTAPIAPGGSRRFYAPLVVSDEELARGCGRDARCRHRLRDALRSLGFGEGEAAGSEAIAFETPGVSEAAAYAGESSALQESDLGLALGERVDAVERRLSGLERRPWSRVRAKRRSLARMRRACGSDCSPRPHARRSRRAFLLLALAVFWLEALGWPMAKGRDTWDYLAYYLQLLDSDPPLSALQLFRTPVTPLVLGIPLDLGEACSWRPSSASSSRPRSSPGARSPSPSGAFRRSFSAFLLLAYPRTRRSTTRRRATRSSRPARVLGAPPRADTGAPERVAVRRARGGIAGLVLIRGERDPPSARPRAARRRRAVAQARRLVGRASRPRCSPRGLGHAQRRALRLHDGAAGRAWVPFLRVFTDDRTIAAESGDGSRRLGDLVEREVLGKEPFAGLGVTLEEYFANGSNYETVRLIALSDRVLGRDENYDVLFESALEAIREHPRTYLGGVADTYRDFLMQAPCARTSSRGSRLRRRRRRRPSRGGRRAAEPAGARAPRGRPVRLRLVRLRLHRLLHGRGPVARVAGRREAASVPRNRGAGAVVGCRAALARGVSVVPELPNRITPRFPRPPLWLLVGRSRS